MQIKLIVYILKFGNVNFIYYICKSFNLQLIMDASTDNGITTRLKEYIDYKGFSNSNFADTAGIPRPTLSQLLSGRNKSINDLLLRKIHEAFPDLNIMWLLFGLGDMRTNPNIEISGAQKSLFDDISRIQSTDSETTTNVRKTESPLSQNSTKEKKTDENSQSAKKAGVDMEADSVVIPFQQTVTSEKSESGERRVKSIIILYSDSSFEVFTPDN